MRVLVIGGNGFIGSHIVDALLRMGHTVRVFDRHPEYFRALLPAVDYHYGDFRDRMSLAGALIGIDAVFHLVSTTFPGTADLDPKADVRENLIGTLELVETLLGLQITRLLFISSGGTVYGVPEQVPVPETHPLRPINSYGIVKAAIEQYIESYRRTSGLSPIIIRASNPFGPRQGHTGVQGVVSTFLNRIARGEEIEIWGDGSVVRDFVDVRDLAELCALAGTSGREGTYNAGSGVGTSLNRLLEVIREVTGKEVQPRYRPARLIDVPVSLLDCTRARQDFGWAPNRSLSEGLENTWRWMLTVDDELKQGRTQDEKLRLCRADRPDTN